MLNLRGYDVRSGEIIITEAQVRRLAQVGATVDVTVTLDGSD